MQQDIFDLDMMIFPQLWEAHWFCICIVFRDKDILIFDSLLAPRRARSVYQVREGVHSIRCASSDCRV